MHRPDSTNSGFTIIELAAVIVIVGLLLAGISAGSTVVKQAELRSVINDFQTFKAAYVTFIKRYNRVPGDMDNAYTLWGAGCGASAAYCNGDSNMMVDAILASSADETAKAWKHMALAGLIKNNIIPIPNSYVGYLQINLTAPSSSLKGAGYYIAGATIGGDSGSLSSPWTDNRTNAVYLGIQSTASALTIGAMNAKDAYNVDKKFDDGFVDTSSNSAGFNTGKIRARQDQAGGTSCINGATYNTTSNSKTCLIGYELQRR